MLRLADQLHKTLAEISQITEAEMNYWIAYSRIKEREMKRR